MTIYNREDYKTVLPQLEKLIKSNAETLEQLQLVTDELKVSLAQLQEDINSLTIPTKTSDLTNDSGFLIGSDFVTEQHEADTSLSVSSGAYVTKTYTLTKSGYYPIAIAGWRVSNGTGSGGTYALMWTMHLDTASDDTAEIRAGVRAVGGAVSGCTLTVDILWRKL